MRSITRLDTLITASANPPVSLDYAKLHIRALGDADDALIAVFINAAASYFEEQTGRQIVTATRELWLDAFPFLGASGRDARIELPHPPLKSVVSVQYVDDTGTVRSVAGGSPLTALYQVSAPAGDYAHRGFVEPLSAQTWPIARDETGAVRIRYTCGYTDSSDDAPELVRGVLCYLIAHFDTFRAAVHEARRGQVLELPYGVQAMLDGFKYSALPTQELHRHAPITAAWPWGGLR